MSCRAVTSPVSFVNSRGTCPSVSVADRTIEFTVDSAIFCFKQYRPACCDRRTLVAVRPIPEVGKLGVSLEKLVRSVLLEIVVENNLLIYFFYCRWRDMKVDVVCENW